MSGRDPLNFWTSSNFVRMRIAISLPMYATLDVSQVPSYHQPPFASIQVRPSMITVAVACLLSRITGMAVAAIGMVSCSSLSLSATCIANVEISFHHEMLIGQHRLCTLGDAVVCNCLVAHTYRAYGHVTIDVVSPHRDLVPTVVLAIRE